MSIPKTSPLADFDLSNRTIAYFSMEIALSPQTSNLFGWTRHARR